jgi:hypothetical protein
MYGDIRGVLTSITADEVKPTDGDTRICCTETGKFKIEIYQYNCWCAVLYLGDAPEKFRPFFDTLDEAEAIKAEIDKNLDIQIRTNTEDQ